MSEDQNNNDGSGVDSSNDGTGPISLTPTNANDLVRSSTDPTVDSTGPISLTPSAQNDLTGGPVVDGTGPISASPSLGNKLTGGSTTILHAGELHNVGSAITGPSDGNVIDNPITEQPKPIEAGGAPGVSIVQPAPSSSSGGAPLTPPSSHIVDGTGPISISPTINTSGSIGSPPSSTDGGGAVPGAPVAEPPTSTKDIGGTSLVATTPHTDESTGYQVFGVQASEQMPIAAAYQAAGETEAEFLADNGEYNNGGTIQKGAYFEIRSGNIASYDANIQTVMNSVNNPGAEGTTGAHVSVTPTPVIAAAPAPVTAPAPPDPAAAAEAVVMGQLTTSATNTEADGRPALGMAPGSTLGDGTGVGDNAHADSSSGALVYDETTNTKINIPSNLNGDFNAGGYEVATSDFLADNGEFNLGGKIQPGAHYEIRADKAFPGASTYDIK